MTKVPDVQTGLESEFSRPRAQGDLPHFTGTQTFYDMSCKDNNRPIELVRAERSRPDNPFNQSARWFVHVVEQNGGSIPEDEARRIVAEGYGVHFDETWYGIDTAKFLGLLVRVHNTDPLTLPVEKARAEIDEILDGIDTENKLA